MPKVYGTQGRREHQLCGSSVLEEGVVRVQCGVRIPSDLNTIRIFADGQAASLLLTPANVPKLPCMPR